MSPFQILTPSVCYGNLKLIVSLFQPLSAAKAKSEQPILRSLTLRIWPSIDFFGENEWILRSFTKDTALYILKSMRNHLLDRLRIRPFNTVPKTHLYPKLSYLAFTGCKLKSEYLPLSAQPISCLDKSFKQLFWLKSEVSDIIHE